MTTKILSSTDQDGYLDLAEIAAPGTPAGSKVRVYAKADGRLYSKDDLGTEALLGGDGTPAGARVYHSIDQDAPASATTALSFDSERYDTDGLHSTVTNKTRITCNTPGVYALGGAIRTGGAAFGSLGIRINGSTVIARQSITSVDTVIEAVYQFAAGDYAELVVINSSGSLQTISALGNYSPEFWMSRLVGGGALSNLGIPTVVGQTLVNVNNTNSVVVSYPAGIQAGDVFLLFATHGWVPEVPSGWTSLDAITGTNINGMTIAKGVVAADVGGSVTVTFSNSYHGEVALVAVRGVASVAGVVDAQTASGTTLAGGVPGQAGDLVIYFAGARQTNVTLTPDKGTLLARRIADTDAGQAVYSGVGTNPLYQIVTWTASTSTSGIYISTVALRGTSGTGRTGGIIHTDNYATPPASPASGDIWIPADSNYIRYRVGSEWVDRFRGVPVLPPPLISTWTWVNQGSATAEETYGGIYLQNPLNDGVNWRLLSRATPTPPYSIEFGFLVQFTGGVTAQAGVGWRQSSDGKLMMVAALHNGTFEGHNWNSPTSFNALLFQVSNYRNNLGSHDIIWFKLEDDNTNRKVYASNDGKHWNPTPIINVVRTSFLTPDRVVVGANSEAGRAMVHLVHYKVL